MLWLQASGNQGVECGVLNKYGPHRLMRLNAWPIVSDATRKCSLVGGSVSPWRRALRYHKVKLHPVWYTVLLLLPADQDVKLFAPSPAPS